jgi:hypothetical protein
MLSRTRLNRSASSATWSVLMACFRYLPQSEPIPRRPYRSSVR